MNFTMESALTTDDLAAFERDGFCVRGGLYSTDEIHALSDWMDRMAAKTPERGKEMYYFEDDLKHPGGRILNRLELFADHPEVQEVIYGERMVRPLAQMLGDEPVLFKEKINFKLPGGDGFKPHQDIQPGWDQYAPYFISVLVTIDESTLENGCLEFAAGHHRRGWIGRPWEPMAEDELKGIEFVSYPMQSGDVVFFDCFVPHQSAPNLTDKPRRNLYLTYNRRKDGDHRMRYFNEKRQNFPPENEREPGKTYSFRV